MVSGEVEDIVIPYSRRSEGLILTWDELAARISVVYDCLPFQEG